MLPRSQRLVDPAGFSAAVRTGRRAASRTVVVHVRLPESGSDDGMAHPPRVGFVVSKAVGSAVARNRVKRRLRHQARELLDALPGSAVLVVRALPAAAEATSTELGADLERCLRRIHREVS